MEQMHLPSLSVIVTVVTALVLLIRTTGFVVVRVTTNSSSSSTIASSVVSTTMVSVVLPGSKFSSVDETALKSAVVAVLGDTIALNEE
jgi:hypothetical protein